MGYICHDAIIVTSWDRKYLRPAIHKAEELGLRVSGYVEGATNGYLSFLIAPDGSKEGWEESDRGDSARREWKEWAHEQRKNNDLWIDWIHVSYAGDNEDDNKIVDHHHQ